MKIKYSALVSDARGKLNGSVASKNRYGQYFRNKMTPVNRRTDAQMRVRGAFASISSAWRNLTQSQRDAWAAVSKDNPFKDIFGDSHVLQGNAYFQKINMLLSTADLPLLDTPVKIVTPTFQLIDMVTPFNENNMIVEVAPYLPEDVTPAVFAIYATPSVSAGREFLKNEYRHIGNLEYADLANNQLDIADLYKARFGSGVAGSRIGIGVVGVDYSGGASIMAQVEDLFQ